eukprot:CAMPEP_0113557792 /NCGR_PEP_ID=MMETSP0015_2-20120614/17986_1 /TAXON_ID=2838 /ORGANISM="Odontella" /LENGTH=567 /DNA_ID=CAMNT_0000459253 /DNA_START=165 /DNA_END=1864 /DNA_ORIENTATION=+ /assembly_acc=CAM_ASM_000160
MIRALRSTSALTGRTAAFRRPLCLPRGTAASCDNAVDVSSPPSSKRLGTVETSRSPTDGFAASSSYFRREYRPSRSLRTSSASSTHRHHRHLGETPSSSKLVPTAHEALTSLTNRGGGASPLFPGATVAVGGFGLSGTPETLLNALSDDGFPMEAKELTVVSLTAGVDEFALGKLVESGRIKRFVSSYVGENKNFESMFFGGELEVELTPQGTIAARLRAAGAGIPAFYTPTGAGTIYAEGGIPIKYKSDGSMIPEIESPPREVREFPDRDGITRKYVMEEALHADVSLVKAWKADTRGNLVFRGTARNANPDCAMAGRVCIAEAEEIVEAGELSPDEIHLPGVYVHRLIHAADNEKRIERLKVTTAPDENGDKAKVIGGGRGRIMRRTAREFKDGMYVNLGIGMPTLASNFVPDNVRIELQAENGLMGIGPYPSPDHADPDYVNAGKETITAIPGASSFASSDSFAMIRGGHLDLTVLGALQASSNGDLASWIVPGKLLKGMGGAMDLVGSPGSRVVVTMDHVARDGTPKLLDECTLPLTGRGVVDRIITDMGVFDVDKEGRNGGG